MGKEARKLLSLQSTGPPKWVATLPALVTVGFSCDDELEHFRLSPMRKGAVQPPEDGRWSNDCRFARNGRASCTGACEAVVSIS